MGRYYPRDEEGQYHRGQRRDDEILGRIRDRATVDEGRSHAALRRSPQRWGTEVECASAIARLERDGALEDAAVTEAFDRLTQLAGAWHEVEPNDGVREAAVRFLRVHPLRAADALQLAAAFVAAEQQPPSLALITLDDRLAAAARKEGFAVVDIVPTERDRGV